MAWQFSDIQQYTDSYNQFLPPQKWYFQIPTANLHSTPKWHIQIPNQFVPAKKSNTHLPNKKIHSTDSLLKLPHKNLILQIFSQFVPPKNITHEDPHTLG